MIQQLAVGYNKTIATILLFVFYLSVIAPVNGAIDRYKTHVGLRPANIEAGFAQIAPAPVPGGISVVQPGEAVDNIPAVGAIGAADYGEGVDGVFNGGPTQPEMASFKPVGTDNMVNLFTGDFSYNIPLLDVGGYPVNIFYDGGVTMEQEASWVGLGWNINPGNINRNMRGIPDDFNGTDTIVEKQDMKPNKTWGVNLAADLEALGIKFLGLNASVGVSFNNYLGPSLELGLKGGVNFKISDIVKTEKFGNVDSIIPIGDISGGFGLGATLNSRYGFTLSPNASLSAKLFKNDRITSMGLSAATSYNSRYGIKDLQISGQLTFSKQMEKTRQKDGTPYYNSNNMNLYSSSISFAKPSYLPAIRMPITNSAFSGHFQLGPGIFGGYGSAEIEVYFQKAKIDNGKRELKKPAVGYMYYERAMTNPNAVMDFSRLGDREVTAQVPVISAPQYAYDVFSIQGEGTGGSIRAYRNDLGYVRDNYTASIDGSGSLGVDVGIPGHIGGNFNIIRSPSVISEWQSGNRLADVMRFKNPGTGLSENVYFRNPGENSVLNPQEYARIGGTDMVRFKLAGDGYNPRVEPVLERFSRTKAFLGTTNVINTPAMAERKKRTQVTSFLTAVEASRVGLDTNIRTYSVTPVLSSSNNLVWEPIQRIGDYRKAHHISQITVTEATGKRYIYGVPVYNKVQRDYTFSVENLPNDDNHVAVTSSQIGLGSDLLLENNKKRDGYVQIRETPPFANAFLLSGLISPDYVDVTGNGITEDDLGTAVKFNYSRIEYPDRQPVFHRWRTPHTTGDLANFSPGNYSEVKDDKGIISYGERESWYLHSVESKTMIALFTLEDRNDANGTVNEWGGINPNDNSLKRLRKIDLYSKADLKKNGTGGAKPIKTVHFEYNYSLCGNTPDNNGYPVDKNGNPVAANDPANVNTAKGKLTLAKIYFTYNGKSRASKNQYVFSYTYADGSGNPGHQHNGSDRWGNYKPKEANPGNLKNGEYPYCKQDKILANNYAGAWALKRILLPSGGQLEITYESDDYAFVQNKRAAQMMQIAGFGSTHTAMSDRLYDVSWPGGVTDNFYVFVRVPEPCESTVQADVFRKYLLRLDQLAVRLAVKMTNTVEYITAYGTVENCGMYDNSSGSPTIWIKLKAVDGYSPLTLAALDYLREHLPGQAFPAYDVSESSGIKQIGEMLVGMLDALRGAFKNPLRHFQSKGMAQYVTTTQSAVRLLNPSGFKYGGGNRVKEIILKDNWKEMTAPGSPGNVGQFTSIYGQRYDYTTTEVYNGSERTISSGVASYEPSIGGEENPFHSIVLLSNKLPLGPASYGSVEMPVLDAFFPSPSVGYSKVTVRSRSSVTPAANEKLRSAIGRQVTEYYTARDFPVYYNHTSFDPSTDLQAHKNSTTAFFYKYAFDSRALSQGFVVETNDMHGKMKSQSSYAANDTTLRVNYTENFYRNTGSKGLNEKFDFAYASQSGVVQPGNMGIDIELMTDVREFKVATNSREVQVQVDLFPVILPFWLPFIWPVTGRSDNNYRAVTTTKVINYHSILDSVVVIDKGSQVSTKNLVYDAETGEVLVNRTNNEFDKPIYTTTYPAYWAYSGMGLAYKNIDAVYSGVNFYDGRMTTNHDQNIFESGDELYIYPMTLPTTGCAAALAARNPTYKIWVFDKNKSNTSLTVPVKDLYFMNDSGRLFTANNVTLKIIRSGKRNFLGDVLASVTSMKHPVQNGTLDIGGGSNVINASAAQYKEKWSIDCVNPGTISNPYQAGILGNFRPHKSFVFYGSRWESDPNQQTAINRNGFLADYSNYWVFNAQHNLVPNSTTDKWVWNNETMNLNTKGMETETRDALYRYTGLQMAYLKSMPVAIGQNARKNEMMYEGFEDYGYNESINNSSYCADSNYRFTGFDNIIQYGNNVYNITYTVVNNGNGTQTVTVNWGSTPPNTPAITISYFDGTWHGNTGSAVSPRVLTIPAGNWQYQLTFNCTPPITVNITELNATQISVRPHSGDKMLMVNAGSEDQVPVYIDFSGPNYNTDDIQFNFPTGTIQNTTYTGNPGVNGTATIDKSPGGSQSGSLSSNSYLAGFNVTTSCSGGVGCSGVNFNGSAILNAYYIPTQSTTLEMYLEGQTVNIYNCSGVTSLSVGGGSVTVYDDATNTVVATGGSGGCTVTGSRCAIQMTNYSYTPGRVYRIQSNLSFYGSVPACNAGGGVFFNILNYIAYQGSYTPISCYTGFTSNTTVICSSYTQPIQYTPVMRNPTFGITKGKKMLLSAWVKEDCGYSGGSPCFKTTYDKTSVLLKQDGYTFAPVTMHPSGPIVDGWQKIEGTFTVPEDFTYYKIDMIFRNTDPSKVAFFDDIRIHPFNANMKSYVYDRVNLRLTAELDENNYASFYEYDEEGTLIRTKAETRAGIKTITETRSAKQKTITTLQ